MWHNWNQQLANYDIRCCAGCVTTVGPLIIRAPCLVPQCAAPAEVQAPSPRLPVNIQTGPLYDIDHSSAIAAEHSSLHMLPLNIRALARCGGGIVAMRTAYATTLHFHPHPFLDCLAQIAKSSSLSGSARLPAVAGATGLVFAAAAMMALQEEAVSCSASQPAHIIR